jgi:hypothetical protein
LLPTGLVLQQRLKLKQNGRLVLCCAFDMAANVLDIPAEALEGSATCADDGPER